MADLPTTRVTGARFAWEENARVFQSPSSGGEQVATIWGRWRASYEYDLLSETESMELIAFLEDVGRGGTFTVMHPLRRLPTPVWTHANGAVKGASQTGKSLLTDGWPNGTLILSPGDFVGLPTGQIVRVKANVTSDGSGNATITFGQTMRASPGDNGVVKVVQPKFTMKLTRPIEDQMSVPALSSYTVEMVEDM